MISIIICSRKPDIPIKLKQNIADSIGCEYELIVIDNVHAQYSIFQAYNEGVERAKGDILCFMHDDIWFHTMNWGQIVERSLQGEIGVLGVIGNQMLPKCPSSWWTSPFKQGQVRHHFEWKNEVELISYGDGQNHLGVTVDGLWFCMPRAIFDVVRFDDVSFSGFHCYDTDICMQALNKGYQVLITTEITIGHDSVGCLGKDFYHQRELWFEKWKTFLPIWREINLSENEAKIINSMSEELDLWTKKTVEANDEVLRLKHTRAFKLGKALLLPFSKLRSCFR